MKKIFIVFAILCTNIIFTSCTDLDDHEQDLIRFELQNTTGEEEQDPDPEEDPDGND